jgi:SAM-dependent methyltransferase
VWRCGDRRPRVAIIRVVATSEPYYRHDLALVHHLAFGFHADACAPGILALLEPVRERRGLVLELGCGSGLLTRHLVEAGHRVVATDASPAMLDLAREVADGAEEIRPLALPDDPLPACDAIVSVGHVLSYLADEASVERALVACAAALRPGGVFAVDLCDLRYGEARRDHPGDGRVGEAWAIVARFSLPRPNLFVREITTFLREEDGTWRRDDERHENVLLDTARVPGLLAPHGLDVRVSPSFGDETLPDGLVAIVGRAA